MTKALAIVLPLLLAAGAAAEPLRVEISRADCARLVEHVPAPDVQYRPGVDVRGDPVPPADLGGGVDLALPETVTVLIEVDLFGRFGLPSDGSSYDGSVHVGVVRLDEGGRATLNGRPLQTEEQARLARRCQEIVRDRR